MNKVALTRRQLLQLSSASAATLALPTWMTAAAEQPAQHAQTNLYATLLQTWCDGLLAHQVTLADPALHGALLCPACSIIHGRCADALYPLLRVAHTTGDHKYLTAATSLYDWAERNVSREDGSWINDVTLSSWQGITVFHAVALAEALHHHGALLDPATRQRWTARLARAAKFLDGFISIQTGNINYPVTSTYCLALLGLALNEPHYTDRARKLAAQVLDYFSPNNFLYGEGHPLTTVTAKKCRPVDLGYNVEESLPALAQYALLTNDQPVLDRTIAALRTHLEFMLPNGAWDNSWGTRNYKWSWWGSRTSDGCHPALVLLAAHDPVFREAAYRNLELMQSCTHKDLLYGGPDYFAHGDQPCIHHSFTHAKSLATVLDSQKDSTKENPIPSPRLAIPRDQPYGLKSFPEIGTHLAAIGDWRATVTEYDWEYVEQVQSGSGNGGGGHVSGGSLSLLYHRTLGPLCTASMTQYQIIEISNQQVHLDSPHMALTPRIELTAAGKTYTSASDFTASLTANASTTRASFEARGRLLTAAHQPPPAANASYNLAYNLTPAIVEIIASTDTTGAAFILPIIARQTETVEQPTPKTIRITKPTGTLTITTDHPTGFNPIPQQRTFNLVPGFECAPLTLSLTPTQEIRIQLEATQKT